MSHFNLFSLSLFIYLNNNNNNNYYYYYTTNKEEDGCER